MAVFEAYIPHLLTSFAAWLKERRRVIIFIAIVALIARLAVFDIILHAHGDDIANVVGGAPMSYEAQATHDMNIAGDCYFETSSNLLAGHGFSCELLPPYEPYQYGVPLYPLLIDLLLLMTHSYYGAIVLQILLTVVTCVLGMYAADVLLPWAKASTFVGIFLALEPNQVLTPLNFSSEVAFMPGFFLCVILLAHYLTTRSTRALVWAGAILGLVTLAKPTTQYLPVILVLFVLWQWWPRINRKLIIDLAVFAGVFLLMLLPWLYGNYRQFGSFSLSTQATRNLYIALLPSVISIQTGESFDNAQAKLLEEHPNNFTFANSVGMTRYTLGQLLRYPAADVKMALLSGFTFFTADDVSTLYANTGIKPNLALNRPATMLLVTSPVLAVKTAVAYLGSNVAPILIARIFFILMLFAFCAGVYAAYRYIGANPALNLSVLLVFYFFLTTMSNGFGVTARFRMPIEAFILALAYGGALFLYKKLQSFWASRKSYGAIA